MYKAIPDEQLLSLLRDGDAIAAFNLPSMTGKAGCAPLHPEQDGPRGNQQGRDAGQLPLRHGKNAARWISIT